MKIVPVEQASEVDGGGEIRLVVDQLVELVLRHPREPRFTPRREVCGVAEADVEEAALLDETLQRVLAHDLVGSVSLTTRP